jgi:hypothetical protein
MRDYIPVKKHWIEMHTRFDKPYWAPVLKFPIEKNKIDKSLFDYQNKVLQSDVLYMLMNFNRDAWMPITLNKDHYLLDGQHRLELARQMGLSYIDVIIENSDLLKGDNKKEGRNKRRSKEALRLEARLKELKTEIMKLETKGIGALCSYD